MVVDRAIFEGPAAAGRRGIPGVPSDLGALRRAKAQGRPPMPPIHGDDFAARCRCGFVMAALLLPSLACVGPIEPLKGPVREGEPISEVGVALDALVSDALRLGSIVGCSVAIVRDGVVALERAYGARNSWSREPVATGTVFPAASLAKPIVAYAALRQVDEGLFGLDQPLDKLLEAPWARADRSFRPITLRHVLSHRSGLSNLLLASWNDRRVHARPGSRFRYSGNGFSYLQAILEANAGSSLDLLIAPHTRRLGMHATTLRWDSTRDQLALPHIRLSLFLWGVLPWIALAWLLAPRLATRMPHGSARGIRHTCAVLGIAVAMLASVTTHRVPIPIIGLTEPHAAGSLYTTAGDYARFLSAVMAAHGTTGGPLAHISEAQVRLSGRVSWGLGIGLQHGDDLDAVWHWGLGLGYQAFVVGFPKARAGIVVLTTGASGEDGLLLARQLAFRGLGGEHYGYWRDLRDAD